MKYLRQVLYEVYLGAAMVGPTLGEERMLPNGQSCRPWSWVPRLEFVLV